MNAHTDLPAAAAPDALLHNGRRVLIGSKASALLAMLWQYGGCVTVANAKAIVFGDVNATRSRLDSLACRLNRKLVALGCAARVSVCDGTVNVI